MHPAACRLVICLATASLLAFDALANPTGPTVISGSASFATSGNTLTVTNTPGTLIHWQSFSIPAGNTTRFQQESASSTVFNRVTGGSPSEILGQMSSNGRVVLINPNGIAFGAGAQINVSGLLASSLHIEDNDLLNGQYRFANQGANGSITNAGSITSNNGVPVILIGRSVSQADTGSINALGGQIALAAGERVRIASMDNPALMVEVTVPENVVSVAGLLGARKGRLRIWDALRYSYKLVDATDHEWDVTEDISSRSEVFNEALAGRDRAFLQNDSFWYFEVEPDNFNHPLETAWTEKDNGEWALTVFGPPPSSPMAVVVNINAPPMPEPEIPAPEIIPDIIPDIFVGRPPEGIQRVDMPMNSLARESFYRQLVNKSPEEVNAYWNRLLTSSAVKRPLSFATEEEAIRYLENTPNAIGYIDDKRVTRKLKIIYRFPK